MTEELLRVIISFGIVFITYALALSKNRWEIYLISAFAGVVCSQLLFTESVFYGAISIMFAFSGLFRCIWCFVGTRKDRS